MEKKKPSEAQKRASAKYKAANIKQIKFECNMTQPDDAAIYEFVQTRKNKQKFLKGLIKDYMESGK